MILSRCRVPQIVPALIVGRDILESRAVGHQKLVSRRTMISKRAHYRAVVIPVIWPAVRLNDGPVREIPENQFGRVFDAVLFFYETATTERLIATANDRVSAN